MKNKTINNHLLELSLNNLHNWITEPVLKAHAENAFRKALKPDSEEIIPPAISLLIAKDLDCYDEPFVPDIACACAYFYTAADLLDDIQDKDSNQPILKCVSSEQALNIVNILLMGAYQSILKSKSVSSENKVKILDLFTQTGICMSYGQFWDLEATNNRSFEYPPEKVAEAKAGSELGCFLACIPTALGYESRDFHALGESMGILLQIFTDYFDIWIVPNKNALSEDLTILKNSLPLYSARKDNEWGEKVSLALAGINDTAPKQLQIRRLLSQTQAVENFDEIIKKTELFITDILKKLPDVKNIKSLTELYLKRSQDLLTGLRKLRTVVNESKSLKSTHSEFVRSMAIDYLQFIPDFRDTWEVQRWGFLEEPILYGNIFNPLLIMEALAQYDINIEEPLEKIIMRSSEQGWHYYSNTKKIPTDTDDLGQVLHVYSLISNKTHDKRFDYPLTLLTQNIKDSGECPTWLCDEKIHHAKDVKNLWFGDECNAVMANLYYGLACHDPVTYSKYIDKGIKYILSQYNPDLAGWRCSYYPSLTYANYLVSRLFTKQNVAFDFSSIINRLETSQKLDGSWKNSPQETAFAVLFLKQMPQSKKIATALNKAEVFLSETQIFDGSWPAEDLFICPGKAGRYEMFGHAKLTTAFCLRALR